MRNFDAIIRFRIVLCETSMLLFVSVWCYAKPRCYYSFPYCVMRNLDAIIETSMLLFVSVWCYAKPRCYYSCPYGVMRNLDAIIRVPNYVRLNPGLQRARPLWSGASDRLIMHILPAERKFMLPSMAQAVGKLSSEHLEQPTSPNLDSLIPITRNQFFFVLKLFITQF